MSETWIRDTIKAKSDQLNADDLIGGPITVTVTAVKQSSDEKQPAIVCIDGGYQPYKPCKTMRRVMVLAWGERAIDWVGRKLTLYREPTVRYGGKEVGGIQISAMSHIGEQIVVALQVAKGKKETFTINPIGNEKKPAPTLLDKWRAKISGLSSAAKGLSKPIGEAFKTKDASGLAAVEEQLDALATDERDVLREFIKDVLEAIQ